MSGFIIALGETQDMKNKAIIVGRTWALALTYSVLFTLLIVLAEDAHMPSVAVAHAPPAALVH